MANAISMQDLEDAKIDVGTISTAANSLDPTLVNRLGRTQQTLSGAIGSIAAITDRGAWATGAAYLVKDMVWSAGTAYICVLGHTAGATFAGDSAKWRVYQGLLESEFDEFVADLANDTDPANGAGMVGGASRIVADIAAVRAMPKTGLTTSVTTLGYTVAGKGAGTYRLDLSDTTSADNGVTVIVATDGGRWKLQHEGTIWITQAGALGGGVDDSLAINAALSAMPNPSSGYYGGGEVRAPEGKWGISTPLVFPKSGITLKGDGSLSSIIYALPGFVGTEMLRIDPIDHPSYVIYRNCNVRDIGFDHNNVAGIRSITANSLNDNCEFKNIRSINFDGTVFALGKSSKPGALLSQGVTIDSWDAITSTDVVDDVFVVDDANECLFINNKALGLSSGASDKTGFHIGRNGLAQGITLIGNSVAHLPAGKGVRFNRVERAWATNNTLENVLHDIHIGHDTTNSLCFGVECYANRHYPTPGAPATQRDYYVSNAWSAKVSGRENAAIEITSAALNCEAYLPTNRTDGTSLPPTVTLSSVSSIVHETHKSGTAIHHNNGSLSFTTSSSGIFDIKLPGGGFIRGDSTRLSLIGASGKAARLLANGGSVEVDSSGRVLIASLTTTVPGVANCLYKDVNGFVKIT